nr:hypothetical protein [Tanacetum cinerariifolium]
MEILLEPTSNMLMIILTKVGNPVKKILLKLNLSDQRSILTDLQVTPTKSGRMLFLAYASFMDFTVYQMDVKSALLYGTIEEEVYVSQPPGFVDLEFLDIVRVTIEKTLFIKKINVDTNDIIFGSTKRSLSTESEQLMHKRFLISSMGELTFFLRLQVEQQKDGIFLSQNKYVSDILKKFSFSSVKSASTPIETHKPLSKDAAGIDVDVHLYRYLKGQPTLGLWYPKDSPLDLISYSDRDYTGASLDIKSTTGGCQFLGLKLKGYLINDGYADLVQYAGDYFNTAGVFLLGFHQHNKWSSIHHV